MGFIGRGLGGGVGTKQSPATQISIGILSLTIFLSLIASPIESFDSSVISFVVASKDTILIL